MIKEVNMYSLKLFFSWQSDIKGNHETIRKALAMACDTIKEEGTYDIKYTESTWERSGSPIIEKVVMEKAKDCDLFVADLTPVANTQNKSLPNPNVMLELGVAKSSLIDDTILLLYTGDLEASKMPFDINHQRMSRFSKAHITDYVRAMAETAVKNPKHSSVFDNNDKFLYYDRNVKVNINSGKYLPHVYLENREVKQHLRDFVAPYTFCKLLLERCDMIDTYRINRNRRLRHKESFIFDIEQFKTIPSEEELSEFYRRTKELKEYVNGKYNELHGNNSDYLSYSKYGQQVIHLEYILSKILLVTTSAGQGKTNLICDIVDNVLLKRGIPFVYMNGYEIDSNNICESFARMMLPTSNASFDETIKGLSTYCNYKRCPVIFIIDGLNENPIPETFSRKLQVFLDAVLQYDCVKVIMTCRTEYYKECFTTFDDAFKDKMIKIGELNKHLDDDERGRLLDNYLRYFKITAQFEHHVQEILCDDLLLLRIFCEANRNKNLGLVHSIKREELFTEYYDIMTSNLIEKVQIEEGYKLSENRVKDFITSLIDYMISNGMFFNVPLSYLESKFTNDEQRIFSRFLEENILLRKDLTPNGKGLFGRKEVINFTYDSFRDYLLSAYLTDFVYTDDRNHYEKCILEYTSKGHQIREGLTPFLFVHSKKNNNNKVLTFLKTFDWYEDVFEEYIWDVLDDTIDEEDIKQVIILLQSEDPSYVAKRLIFHGRWNEALFPHLNIRILLDYLSTLNDKALNIFIDKVWNDKPLNRWHNADVKSKRKQMIESLDKLLENKDLCNNMYFHNLFELLLYIAICTPGYGFDVFMKYHSRHKNSALLDRVSKTTQSSKLVIKLEEIRRLI